MLLQLLLLLLKLMIVDHVAIIDIDNIVNLLVLRRPWANALTQ